MSKTEHHKNEAPLGAAFKMCLPTFEDETTTTGEQFIHQPREIAYLKDMYELVGYGWSLNIQVKNRSKKGFVVKRAPKQSIMTDEQLEAIKNLPAPPGPGKSWFNGRYDSYEPTQKEIEMRLIHLMHYRAEQGYLVDVTCLHPPTKFDTKYADKTSIIRLQNAYMYLCLDFRARTKSPDDPEFLLTEWRQEDQRRFLEWSDKMEAQKLEEEGKTKQKAHFLEDKTKKSSAFKAILRDIFEALVL